MNCPVCTAVNLVMSERQGIEIDYCPECRGVWLDRGELDKIIERTAPQEVSVAQPPPHMPQPGYPQQVNYGTGHAPGYGQGHGYGHKPHKKKSFLEELFD